MAMFPIFMIGLTVGLTVGGVLGYVFSAYKKEKPSETRLRILETELAQEKKDKEMLNKLVEKLYKQIDDLKDELTLEKNVKE